MNTQDQKFNEHYSEISRIANLLSNRNYSIPYNEKRDYTQDIIIKAYTNINRVDFSKMKVSTYVFNIAKSISIDIDRKRKANKRSGINISLDNTFDDSNVSFHEKIGVSDMIFDDSEMLYRKIKNYFKTNKHSIDEIIFNEYFIENKKMNEISDEQSININTIKTIIRRIKQNLQQELVEFAI